MLFESKACLVKENRKHQRIECKETVAIILRGKQYKGVIKNMSEIGFYVELEEYLFTGLKIDLGYYSETSESEYKFNGRIVRRDKNGIGVAIRYEM